MNMRKAVLLALVALALATTACTKSPATAESFRVIENDMVRSSDENKSRFGKECGTGLVTALVFSSVEITDGGGNTYVTHIVKHSFPKGMILQHFWEKDTVRCHLVVDSGTEAQRLNREHAQALIDGTKGASLEDRPSTASAIGNLDGVGIRLPDGTAYLVDYYVSKELVQVQEAQKDLNVFLSRRWNGQN